MSVSILESPRDSGIILRDEDGLPSPAKKAEGATVFEELSTLRIDRLNATDKSIEGLVKKCLFWKDQLDVLMEKNRLLRHEEKTLRKDYEKILEKTRSNTGVLESLKDSEKQLIKDHKNWQVENHHLSAASYINVDLTSYKISLEDDKKELNKTLKSNNDKLSKINRIHKRFQDEIIKQRETTELNEKRFSRVLAMLKDCYDRDTYRLKEVNQAFAIRDPSAEKVDKLINNNNSNNNNADQENTPENVEDTSDASTVPDDSSTVPDDTSTIPDDSTVSISQKSDESDQIPTNETSEDPSGQIQATEDPVDQKDPVPPEPETNPLSPADILKCKLEMIKKENYQLQQIYTLLINRMKNLNDLYMENNDICNKKGMELHKIADKASDVFDLILQTRKTFTIPQRKLTEELDVKIRNQEKKNEALRGLISMFLSFNTDTPFYSELMSDVQNFYECELKGIIEGFH